MKKAFHQVADLLAYLRSPASEAHEGYLEMGEVSAALADLVMRATGLDVVGFALVLDHSGIQHTFRKHGAANAAGELARGQVPIADADSEVLANGVQTPADVKPGQLRHGLCPLACVEFSIEHATGRLTAIFEVRPGRRRLVLTTLYKKRPTA